jgi:hypothetical protein
MMESLTLLILLMVFGVVVTVAVLTFFVAIWVDK